MSTGCISSSTPPPTVLDGARRLAAVRGLGGIAHGGIVTTILDEVMAWALIDHDHWGVTARMAVTFKRPVPIGEPIRGEGWVVEARRRVITAEGSSSTPTASPRDLRGDLRRRAGGQESRAQGPLPVRDIRMPDEAGDADDPGHGANGGRRAPSPSGPWRSSLSAAIVPRRWVARSRTTSTRPEPSSRPWTRALDELADPDYQEGTPRSSPGSRAHARRRWPLLSAILRGFKSATRNGARRRCSTSPPHCSASRSSRSMDRVRAPRPDRRRGARADLAAAPARRGTGRTGPRSMRSPTRRARHPRRALPVGGARAAGVLAVPLGAPPGRLDGRDDPARERGSGRQPDRRRPRGLALLRELIGDAEPDVHKALSWAYRTLAQVDRAATVEALRDEADGRHRETTATAPGSSATSFQARPAEVADELRGRLGTDPRRPARRRPPRRHHRAGLHGRRSGDPAGPPHHPRP